MRTLLVLLLLTAVARADVIVVGKREFHGEIVDETFDQVKIRVGNGVLTFDKKSVTEIRREDEIETLAGEARALAKTLDVKALDLFDRAIAAARKKGDDKRADSLQKERNVLATKLDKQTTRESATVTERDDKASADDLFLLEADLDAVRVYVNAAREGDKTRARQGASQLVQLGNKHASDNEPRWAVGCFALARTLAPEDGKNLWSAERTCRLRACGLAVRERDGKIARAAIAPIAKEEANDARVAYLEGRAFEVSSNPTGARDSYKRALEGANVPMVGDLPVDWLRELARRRVLGQPIGAGSPGIGEQWRRAESAHFVVYHELGDDFTDEEPRAFEDARAASLLRLGLSEGDVNGGTKIPMFIFKNQENYRRGGGPEWASGHVDHVALEDGEWRTVMTFPGRRMETNTMQHELAHVLVGEAFPKLILPAWANEGVACYAEPDSSRNARRVMAGRALQAGVWVPLKDFMTRIGNPTQPDRDAIDVFYSEATVVFSALVPKASTLKEALEVAARIARKGPDAGLRELGTDTTTLEAEIKADLQKM